MKKFQKEKLIYCSKLNKNVLLKINKIDLKSFYEIRELNSFIFYDKNSLLKALKNSTFVINLYCESRPIGIGRVVGDGNICFFLKDIAVHPNYRRLGLGSIIVQELLEAIYSICADNTYIGLMSTPNKEKFYENFGFIKRPTNILGSGMVKYYVKK